MHSTTRNHWSVSSICFLEVNCKLLKQNKSFSSETTRVEKLSTSLQEKWSKNEVDIFATKLLYEANENSDFNLSKQ